MPSADLDSGSDSGCDLARGYLREVVAACCGWKRDRVGPLLVDWGLG